MWNIPTLGFHEDNFNAVVNGIVKAIQMAHTRIQPASILINVGNVASANINRSPTAYLGNPAEERAKYSGDTDTTMTLIKVVGANGKEMGTLNWFPVHGTSMSNTNGFISGDNKGYAEFAFERLKNANNSLPGQEDFVAAFAQSNSGDVSPNTKGAFCDNGDPCELAHSTCGGWSENCHGYGPGKNEFESTQIIGDNQFKTALGLYNAASVPLVGPLGNVFTYVNMENVTVAPQFSGTSQPVTTCPAAMGDAFAAGTTDGPGEFNFKQGTNGSENAYWNWLASHILAAPPANVVKCQYPKPILIYTGGLKWPCEWTQGILPLQMFRIGQLFIAATPVEVTTMSGRRLRASITAALTSAGVANPIVVLASPSNAYSHYVTTPEEYIFQRYEGASTLFGPWTLPAYQQEYTKLAVLLAKGQKAPVPVRPMDCSKTTFSLQPGVIVDEGPFGKVKTDVKSSYKRGETVSVIFWSANPRNNLRTADTFLTVERQVSANNWVVVANDGDWATRYRWSRQGIAGSLATITWDVPLDAATGTYRIRHFGDYKSFDGDIHSFTGTSGSFILN
jgi:neutral ceramidase